MLAAVLVVADLEYSGFQVRKNSMSPTDDRRRTGRRRLLIAAVVVLMAITQYAGVKDALSDFNVGFRDGVSER